MAEPAPVVDISQLVAEHHAELFRYAYRLTGSTADAEDLTQQTYLSAQINLGQLREASHARGWLYAILRNCFLKLRRQRVPAAAASLSFDLESVPDDGEAELPIDQEKLQLALNELPSDFRLVLLMFYFEDCSYREIASRLAVPQGTVMSRLSRAKQHLRAVLREPCLHTSVETVHAPTRRA